MKVLHVPFTYYPDACGGTEVYVAALAREQRRLGVNAAIAAPGEQDAAYEHEGIPVYRFSTGRGGLTLRELYGEGNAAARAGFERILEQTTPGIVHLHALTAAVSLGAARAAKRRGARVVFTYHTPTVTCQRGTLLRWGREVCDGMMTVRRCAACAMEGQGAPRLVSLALSAVPEGAGRALGRAGLSGGLWTALRMTELVSLRHRTARALLAEADGVVAVSEWVRDLLLRNGVDPAKVVLSRQGLGTVSPAPAKTERPAGAPLRVIFLGRLSRVKGVHILLEALRRAPDLAVALDVYGIVQDEEGRRIEAEIRRAADRRIRLLPPVPAGEVVATIAGYDVLAVPSQWLESGPLVVYEAFAAGTPVLGSRLGGIAELVTDGVDGMLVEPASPAAWATGLGRLQKEQHLLLRMRYGIRHPRTASDVCRETQRIYQSLPLYHPCMLR